ncbi:hypothetical protein [Rhizobium sp. BK176]|uniref:hypothetical protein n=1 Tax=Rhizobium sp. BK176 TaxID=2587071 RepID=UPI0021686F33|nr:hypothetical protein [Rhizobium sp. BK176]MCS4090117.1 hypothetical protein [Rhizobium sp. BK176]
MRIRTRLPVAIPTLKGKSVLCGVEVTVEIADYSVSDAPTVCVIEDSRPRLMVTGYEAKLAQASVKGYRHTDGRFLKMRWLGRLGEPTTSAAAITGFAVEDTLGKIIRDVRKGNSSDSLEEAYREAIDSPIGYEVLYAGVMALPAIRSFPNGKIDTDAAEEAVARAVSRASSLCLIDGIWHEECGEPAIANLYSPNGVRRISWELGDPLDMPTGNFHWTMFPATEYANAVAEPNQIEGWLPTNSVATEIRPPQIGSPEVFGSDFIERETVRHLRCLPEAISQVTKRGRRNSQEESEVLVARDTLSKTLVSEGLLHDPAPAVEAARHLVDVVRQRVEPEFRTMMATFDRTLARWDDRPVVVNEIVRSSQLQK